jgi:PAS domain S-box-containing protein
MISFFHKVNSCVSLLISFVIFLCIIGITQYLSYQEYLLTKQKEHDVLFDELANVTDEFQKILNSDIIAARTLVVIYKEYGIHHNFNSIAKQIINNSQYVEAIQLTKGGVITNVYPYEDYKNTIGIDVLEDSVRNDEANKALKKKDVFFAGPRKLRKGGIGILAKVPIILDGELKGFSTVLTKINTITKALNTNNHKFSYLLSKHHSVLDSTSFLLSDAKPSSKSEWVSKDIPEGDWKLFVTYNESYNGSPYPYPLAITGLLLSFVIGLITHNKLNEPLVLRKILEKKTSSLNEREAELTAFFENVEGAASLLDVNKKYLLFNRRFVYDHKLLSNHAPSLGEEVWSFLPDNLKEQRYKMLDNVLQGNKEIIEVDYVRNGTRVYYRSSFFPVITDGKVTGISTYSIDITKNKEAEEKIKASEELLRKITRQIPGNTYMFEIEENGEMKILFMSRGTDKFNVHYDSNESLEKTQKLIMDAVYVDDKEKFNDSMKEAYQTQSMISFHYRVLLDGNIRWRWMKATPDKDKNGKTLWYGSTSDVTSFVDYLVSIEQILFDIGHVIRRPVSSILGISNLIIDQKLSEEEVKEMAHKLYMTSVEMDNFFEQLNLAYYKKREENKQDIDISLFIDNRSDLFNWPKIPTGDQ